MDSEVIQNEGTNVMQLFGDIEASVQQVNAVVLKLTNRIEKKEIATHEGISLLDVKNQMLVSYLTNVVYLCLRKCAGKSIEGDKVIERLVELRTVLERVRPIDQKLKYQIDKFIKIAVTGLADENDPSRFRANPANMVSKIDSSDVSDSDSEDDDGNETKKKSEDKSSGVYVPPKLAPVHYDGDESELSRQQKVLERARRRALSSSMMQELKEEYLDTPTEVTHVSASRARLSRQQQDKQRYEENYFTRLPTTRKERHRSQQVSTLGTLGDEVTHFEDLSALDGVVAPKKKKSSDKKRKLAGKSTKKKGLKKKRFA